MRLAKAHPDRITAHREHPFLLIHLGQLAPAEAGRRLAGHSNLGFLTSVTNPIVTETSKQPWTNMFAGDALTPDWRALILAYPGRFVMAFDLVWPEHFGDTYVRQVAFWRRALNDLSVPVAHAIAHKNAERLWRPAPVQ